MNTNNSADIQKLISQEMNQNYDEQRENIRLAAKDQIRKIQEENKKYYDKRRKKSKKNTIRQWAEISTAVYGSISSDTSKPIRQIQSGEISRIRWSKRNQNKCRFHEAVDRG